MTSAERDGCRTLGWMFEQDTVVFNVKCIC